MSEVAAVAAITGGVTVMTSGITGFVAWRVSKNSSSVELGRVTAETERLNLGNREDERRHRQSTYHKFIRILIRLYQLLGAEVGEVEVQKISDEYNELLAGVLLFGSPSVRAEADALNDVYNEIGLAFAQGETARPEDPFERVWSEETRPFAKRFSDHHWRLIPLMHADVTDGIIEDPQGEPA
jgi:hypothetical protein